MNKKSFALLSVIILLLAFSFLSINIIQNKTYSNQIDKLKYLELQASIHIQYIKENINLHPDIEINDTRFDLNISREDINTSKIYHIYLKTKDESHISMYDKVLISLP